MAKSIDSLDLSGGESITLRIQGPHPLSFRVHVDWRGKCYIVYPTNKKPRRIFTLTTKGIVRARRMEERARILEKGPP